MVMMDVLSDLVTQLTTRHKDERTGRWAEPLLHQLRRAIGSNLGRTHAGHSSLDGRAPIDVAAFDLYEDIDGRISSMWRMATETGRVDRRPEKNLQMWFLSFSASWALNEITEVQMLLALSRLSSMVNRIETYFDPPQVCEILAACPVEGCGRRYMVDRGGVRHSALLVEYRPGHELVGRCRSCETKWAGDAALVALAKSIDAPIDVDALRDARAR